MAELRTTLALLAVSLLSGCMLPGGDAKTEQQLHRKLQNAQGDAGPVSDAQKTCPVTTMNLSGFEGPAPKSPLCASLVRHKSRSGKRARPDAVPTLKTVSAGRMVVADPCPPDRYLYRVEASDQLAEWSRLAFFADSWRSWAAAVLLRNPGCFDDRRRLRVGCVLRIPDMRTSGLRKAFADYWNAADAPIPDASPLQVCLRQWRRDGGDFYAAE